MKLTEQKSRRFIEIASNGDPGTDALARLLSHDWTFDPRSSLITLLLRCVHEQENILYDVWKNFREELSAPYSATALPCVTAENR